MTGQERHLHRDGIARRNGYRDQPVPESPEWAGVRLPEVNDDKAARAMLALRGITPPKSGRKAA